MRPLLLALAVVTCVLAGTTLNRCLSCGEPGESSSTAAAAEAVVVRGAPLNAPVPQAPEDAKRAKRDLPLLSDSVARKQGKIPNPPAAQPKKKGDGRGLTFNDLTGYEYVYPQIGAPNKAKEQIPELIRKLGGKTYDIQGFMIPVKYDGEDVYEFVLVRDQMWCCYGVMPKMNEWIHVKMRKGRKATFALDIPVTCTGKLDVGELWENGVVMSLYRMECENVVEPPGFR